MLRNWNHYSKVFVAVAAVIAITACGRHYKQKSASITVAGLSGGTILVANVTHSKADTGGAPSEKLSFEVTTNLAAATLVAYVQGGSTGSDVRDVNAVNLSVQAKCIDTSCNQFAALFRVQASGVSKQWAALYEDSEGIGFAIANLDNTSFASVDAAIGPLQDQAASNAAPF